MSLLVLLSLGMWKSMYHSFVNLKGSINHRPDQKSNILIIVFMNHMYAQAIATWTEPHFFPSKMIRLVTEKRICDWLCFSCHSQVLCCDAALVADISHSSMLLHSFLMLYWWIRMLCIFESIKTCWDIENYASASPVSFLWASRGKYYAIEVTMGNHIMRCIISPSSR